MLSNFLTEAMRPCFFTLCLLDCLQFNSSLTFLATRRENVQRKMPPRFEHDIGRNELVLREHEDL